MNIEVRLAEGPLRYWHLELIRRLQSLHQAQVTLAGPSSEPERRNRYVLVDRVLSLTHGQRRRSPALGDRVRHEAVEELPGVADPAPDIRIDLTAAPLEDDRTLRVEFDGVPGEGGALQALRLRQPPLVSVIRGDGTVACTGRPGTEVPGDLRTAFDDLLAGCLTLIFKAVHSVPTARPAPVPGHLVRAVSRPQEVVERTVGSVARWGYRALYRAPHWRVGWRFVDGAGLLDRPDVLPSDWRRLPDDGHHFYADPFPFVHEGELFLFVEDYEHRLRRGVISVVRFDEHGPAHTPRPVLRHAVHLSYPFVLAHEGDVWMIPETSAAGRIELYRALRFPDEWTLVTALVTDMEASDATVFQHGGRWWMTATVRAGGSFSDSLYLWYADRLTGPWTGHPHNPVLIDIASARPAGRVEHRDGRLLRPVQDCRSGYGAALAVAEITDLDEQRFDQQVIGRLTPGPWWPGRRLHTLNRAGRLECIDGSAMSPRFWRARETESVR